MRLLLVEDNPALAEGLGGVLTRAGFATDLAADARDAERLFRASSYDLVVLDLGLPDRDGLSLLTQWRSQGTTPVIVLTARDGLDDRLAGLDGGADDYVIKPVESPELIARIRAVLRRPGQRASRVLRAGALALDTSARSVSVWGKRLPLGRREIGVLEQLMRRLGQVVPRRTLEDSAYGFDDIVGPNAIEASISRLRRALQSADCELEIVTVRGIGWLLLDPEPVD